MKIVEIFRSLQGEGPIAGHPAIFIRFAGCNLRCEWCDTKFAQDVTGRLQCLTETEVWHKLAWAQGWRDDAIVITGGEPFLQEQTIVRLYQQLHSAQDVWFETNGTIVPEDRRILERDWVQVVASPKPTHTNIGTLRALADRTHLHLKFVIGPQAWSAVDAMWVVKEVRVGGQLDPQAVYFMPQGATKQEQLDMLPIVWDACVKHDVRFAPRLHTLTHGNVRGV